MVKHFEKEEMDFSTGVPICPDCKNHTQGEPMDVHDCKNTYVLERSADGRIDREGQCNCWSEAHGRRGD